MVTIVTRAGKGSPLTNTELDANFTNLKSYVDSVVGGVNFHPACNYATVSALSPAATYSNGTAGVGATLTGSSNGVLSIDGVGLISGDEGKRILVKNQGATAPYASLQNGIYVVTQVGTASLTYILTRATDYDTVGGDANEIDAGDFILVLSGSTLANTSWVQQTSATGMVLGTTVLQFDQFSSGVGTGTVAVANGGTGQTTAQAAMNSFAGAVTSGSYLRGNGTNVVMSTIQAADVPTLNQNTTGQAGKVANALIAGTNITFSTGTTYDGSTAITINATGGGGSSGAGNAYGWFISR